MKIAWKFFGFSGFLLFFVLSPYVTKAINFNDLQGHWSETYVQALAEKEVISQDNEIFRPDDYINRAEFVKMLIEATSGIKEDLLHSQASFGDVNVNSWFFPYVETAKRLNLVRGFNDGTFQPDGFLSRDIAVILVVRAFHLEYEGNVIAPFVDINRSTPEYEEINTAYAYCVIDGFVNDQFGSANLITRGEAAKIVFKASNYDHDCDRFDNDLVNNALDDKNVVKSSNSKSHDEAEVLIFDNNPSVGDVEIVDKSVMENDQEVIEESVQENNETKVIVSSLSDQNQQVSILNNTPKVKILDLNFSAPLSENILIKRIDIKHYGLGYLTEIQQVYAMERDIAKGVGKPFADDNRIASLNLRSDPIIVPAGTSKVVSIFADFDAKSFGGEHIFTLDSVDFLEIVAESSGLQLFIENRFPLKSALFKIKAQ